MEKVPKKSLAHDIDHILRVWGKCEAVGKKMGVDMESLVAAVFLHDLGRHYGQDAHGELSAKKAEPLLEKIGFPNEKRKAVLDAIMFHEYFVPKEKRKSIEAKILSDVDRLDALGRVGVMRHLLCFYAKGMPIDEIIEMVKKRWASIELEESKKVGKVDYEIALDFFKELKKELSVA